MEWFARRAGIEPAVGLCLNGCLGGDGMRKPVLYTVGHSNYSIEEFVETLQRIGVDLVVDVRSMCCA